MPDKKTPVNVDISAGASLKVEIKTEIPPESSGRFLDALTDIIRPFSEGRGLRADQIRLQREYVLIEIAKLARHRAELKGLELQPVESRVLVPLLERASLTDEKSDFLKSKWANLLISASINSSPNSSLYTEILGSLDPIHVKILDKISSLNPGLHLEEAGYALDDIHSEMDRSIGPFFAKLPREIETYPHNASPELENVFEFIEDFFLKPGLTFDYFMAGDKYETEPGIFYNSEHEFSFDFEGSNRTQVLQALVSKGLLNSRTFSHRDFPESPKWFELWMKLLALSHFGVGFVEACTDA